MIEIERKYLVKDYSFKELAHKQTAIVQGFLNTHPDRTVRVRISGEKAWMTVKGRSSDDGTKRFEWEQEIGVEKARNLIDLCEPGHIQKTRFEVLFQGQRFEVDEFYGANQGLIIAELELENEHDSVTPPDWLGKEVTGDLRYYISQLSKKPYTTWND